MNGERHADITPGWQERAAKLRETIRNCQHQGEKKRNADGVLFCADCCRHLNEDGTET